MIESQIGYMLGALRAMEERRIGALEPRAAAQAAFVAGVRRRAHGTVWESGGCASWYLDAGGHSILWPDSVRRFAEGSAVSTSRATLRARTGIQSSP